MADNFQALDPDGVTELTFRSTDNTTFHMPWHAVGNAAGTASAPVDATNGLAVDIKGNGLTALQLIDDAIHTDDAAATLGTSKGVGIMGFAGTQSVDSGDMGFLAMTTAGKLLVDLGADNDVRLAVDGPVGASYIATQLYDGDDNIISPVGASTIFRSIDLDESEEEAKATAATLYWLHAVNTTASPLYLKFYNATAASVTVGTTTPVMTFVIPTQGDTNGAGFALSFGGFGVTFSTALTVACTTGLADNDTGAPGANACIVNLGYV